MIHLKKFKSFSKIFENQEDEPVLKKKESKLIKKVYDDGIYKIIQVANDSAFEYIMDYENDSLPDTFDNYDILIVFKYGDVKCIIEVTEGECYIKDENLDDGINYDKLLTDALMFVYEHYIGNVLSPQFTTYDVTLNKDPDTGDKYLRFGSFDDTELFFIQEDEWLDFENYKKIYDGIFDDFDLYTFEYMRYVDLTEGIWDVLFKMYKDNTEIYEFLKNAHENDDINNYHDLCEIAEDEGIDDNFTDIFSQYIWYSCGDAIYKSIKSDFNFHNKFEYQDDDSIILKLTEEESKSVIEAIMYGGGTDDDIFNDIIKDKECYFTLEQPRYGWQPSTYEPDIIKYFEEYFIPKEEDNHE